MEEMLLVQKACKLSFSMVGQSWQGWHRVAASCWALLWGHEHTAPWRRRNIVTLFQLFPAPSQLPHSFRALSHHRYKLIAGL